MIRSAAKNVGWVVPLVDPNDYSVLLDELSKDNTISYEMRRNLC